MIDTLILVSALPALLAALCRDRAGFVLCASLAASYALQWLAVPFHPLVWLVPDVFVALALIRRTMPKRNIAIVALFIPMWAAYLLPDTGRYLLTSAIVIIQFVLTIPAISWICIKQRFHAARGQWGDFDLRVRA